MGCFTVILKPLGSLSTILITRLPVTIILTDQDTDFKSFFRSPLTTPDQLCDLPLWYVGGVVEPLESPDLSQLHLCLQPKNVRRAVLPM